jgi:type III secretion system FlhB-like substrate exporter
MNDAQDRDGDEQATALAFKPGDSAKILAQGRGQVAGRITTVAGEENIPVLQDFALSQSLQRIPVGTTIPDPVFRALGALLEFLFMQESRLAEEDENQP